MIYEVDHGWWKSHKHQNSSALKNRSSICVVYHCHLSCSVPKTMEHWYVYYWKTPIPFLFADIHRHSWNGSIIERQNVWLALGYEVCLLSRSHLIIVVNFAAASRHLTGGETWLEYMTAVTCGHVIPICIDWQPMASSRQEAPNVGVTKLKNKKCKPFPGSHNRFATIYLSPLDGQYKGP